MAVLSAGHKGLVGVVDLFNTSNDDRHTGDAFHVIRWHDVAGVENSLMRLPPEVVESICGFLETFDLLCLRLVCRAWRQVPALLVPGVDIPMKSHAGSLPHVLKNMTQFFPNITTVTLSCLASQLAPGRAPGDAPMSLTWIVNNLTSLHHLKRLILMELPVLPSSSRLAPGWQLSCLQNLRRVTSLDLRLKNCSPGLGRASVQSAQDLLLLGLSCLTQVTHLALRLVDLSHVRSIDLIDLADLSGSDDSLALSDDDDDDDDDGSGNEILIDYHDDDVQGVHALNLVDLDYVEPFPSCQDAPAVSCFQALSWKGCRLQRLEITNVALRHVPMAVLLRCLPQLTSLHLQGQIGLSREAIHAVEAMSGLRELGLSQVQLIYSQDDCEDCPETLMGALCGALERLPHFTSLRFQVADMDMTRFMHTAYLLGLYEHDDLAQQLRSVQLGIVIFDSDHSVGILASLHSLTSLKCEFQTWPLSLQSRDLNQLASLSMLRCLDLLASEQEVHHLLVLNRAVVADLAAGLKSLTRLHFAGLIDFPEAICPELAAWTSLQDVSLVYMCESNDGDSDSSQTLLAAQSDGRARRARTWSRGPNWMCGDVTTWSAGDVAPGRILLDLTHSLPHRLCKLSLSHMHISLASMEFISNQLPRLHTLQMSECGISPLHLLILADAPTPPPLEVLVLYDVPSQAAGAFSSVAGHPISTSAGSQESHVGNGCRDSGGCRASWFEDVHTAPGRLWCRDKAGCRQQQQEPWWTGDVQAINRLAVKLLGKRLQGLEYLMLSLPGETCIDDCEDLLGPLCTLPRLKALTMQAYGCRWSQQQVVRVLQGRLRGARVLHVRWNGGQLSTGGLADSHPYLPLG